MNSIASNVYNLEIIDSYEFEKDLIFIGSGKIYHINTFVGNIIISNISKHYIEKWTIKNTNFSIDCSNYTKAISVLLEKCSQKRDLDRNTGMLFK